MADLKNILDKAEKVLAKSDIDEKIIEKAADEIKKAKVVDSKIVDKVADALDDIDGKKAKKTKKK